VGAAKATKRPNTNATILFIAPPALPSAKQKILTPQPRRSNAWAGD
jgi:hypothetical protein